MAFRVEKILQIVGFCLCILLLTSVSVNAGEQKEEAVVDLLPDLHPPLGVVFPSVGGGDFTVLDWDVSGQVVAGRTYLRVDFGAANIGAGPLYIRGDTVQNQDSTWNGYQRIFRSDGTWWENLAGTFDVSIPHGHVHFEDWAQYRLREVTPGNGVGQVLAESVKTAFCLIDGFRIEPPLPNSPDTPVFFGDCEATVQGESVGWIDFYVKPTPGQNFDITDVPNGVYWLEGESDPANRIIESDETNNIVRFQIQLCHQGGTNGAADSLWIGSNSAEVDQQVIVQVSVSNSLKLRRVVIPITYAGGVPLRLDSVSNIGLRSEILGPPLVVYTNLDSSQAIYKFETTSEDTLLYMVTGSGPILNLYFTPVSQSPAPVDSTNTISLAPVQLQGIAVMIDATFAEICGQFVPQSILDGSFTLEPTIPPCCNVPGDANNSGSTNIADVTFLIARIFSGGSAPTCADQADADGNGSVDIADVTYLIQRIFGGGPAPICGTTGV